MDRAGLARLRLLHSAIDAEDRETVWQAATNIIRDRMIEDEWVRWSQACTLGGVFGTFVQMSSIVCRRLRFMYRFGAPRLCREDYAGGGNYLIGCGGLSHNFGVRGSILLT